VKTEESCKDAAALLAYPDGGKSELIGAMCDGACSVERDRCNFRIRE
jgi:hypothetical protein